MADRVFNGYTFPHVLQDKIQSGSYNYSLVKSCLTDDVIMVFPANLNQTHSLVLRGTVIDQTELDALNEAYLSNSDIISGGVTWSGLSIGRVTNAGCSVVAPYTATFTVVE